MKHLVKFKEALTLRVKWQPCTCRALRVQVAQGQEEGTGGNSFWEGLRRD